MLCRVRGGWSVVCVFKNDSFILYFLPVSKQKLHVSRRLLGLGKSIRKHGWNKLVRDCRHLQLDQYQTN